jgi:hypothetical protein
MEIRNQVIINKGEKAPFSGVISSEETYRAIMKDAFAKDDLQKALEECQNENLQLAIAGKEDVPKLYYMAIGGIVTISAAVILFSALR